MQTLYQRIGGEEVIKSLVDIFYKKVFSDPLIGKFFLHTSIEKLKTMQLEFFTIALGGSKRTSTVSIYDAHHGRGIKREHLTRFTDCLLETLHDIGVNEEDSKEVIARIARYSNDVLGEATVDG